MITRTVVGAVAALALAACGGDPEVPVKDDPAVTVKIPSPSADQSPALVDALAAIVPGLADEPDETIENARNTCSSHLGGAQNMVASTKLRFDGDGGDGMTDDQAQQIIELIAAEPWCK